MSLVKLITPINLEQEKERFLSIPHYHPSFEYNWNTDQILETYRNSLKLPLIQAVLLQDTKQIVKEAQQYFNVAFSIDTLLEAQHIVKNKPEPIPKEDIKQVKTQFEEAFRFFDIPYTFTLSNDHGFFFRPDNKNKTIVGSKHAHFQFFSIDGEVKHEMTHILRYINSQYNNIKKSKDYIQSEEGLAAYLQDYYGAHGEASLFQHAAEYAVTKVALEGSLREMVEYLVSIGFDKELAWQRACRHKFGFKDTSKPGDIMKPAMYFENEMKVKQLNKDELIRLFVGKIHIQDLSMFPEYKGVVPREKIMQFYGL